MKKLDNVTIDNDKLKSFLTSFLLLPNDGFSLDDWDITINPTCWQASRRDSKTILLDRQEESTSLTYSPLSKTVTVVRKELASNSYQSKGDSQIIEDVFQGIETTRYTLIKGSNEDNPDNFTQQILVNGIYEKTSYSSDGNHIIDSSYHSTCEYIEPHLIKLDNNYSLEDGLPAIPITQYNKKSRLTF